MKAAGRGGFGAGYSSKMNRSSMVVFNALDICCASRSEGCTCLFQGIVWFLFLRPLALRGHPASCRIGLLVL